MELKPTFEYTIIEDKELPTSWRGSKNISALERFLQANWEQRSILYNDGDKNTKQQFLDLDHRDRIKTRNYIGTIIFNNEKLDIYPKIYEDCGKELSTKDLITDITTWLSYCDKEKFPFIKTPSSFNKEENTFELFAFIYLQYVEEAIRKQLFFSYQEIRETGSNIKGKIDFVDYATKKFAYGKKHMMDYVYSSFDFDNDVNRIIKATCKMINRITNNKKNKEIIRRIMPKYEEVSDVICSPNDCDKAIIVEQKSIYKTIMQMSKMFLMNNTSSGLQGKIDSFCFLFPTELLFEGFIGGYIEEQYNNKLQNGKTLGVRLQHSKEYLAKAYKNNVDIGDAFKLKEDIVIDDDEDFRMILDTKYKIIESFLEKPSSKKYGVEDDDMKQMVTYAIADEATHLCLIYPLKRNKPLDKDEIYYKIETIINNESHEIIVYILRVPFSMCDDENNGLNNLRDSLNNVVLKCFEQQTRISILK